MKRNTLRRKRHGHALISALVFVVIISLCLAGIGALCVSHYSRATVESDYTAALSLAEAGVNYEYRKISLNTANADQVSVANPNGVTYNLGGGTFRVYCANRNGTTPWVLPNLMYVVSVGTYHGVSRTIQVSSKGFAPPGKYAIYCVSGPNSVWNGSAMDIIGDVGTNNTFSFSGHPDITGNIYFDGPQAGWFNGIATSGYNVVVEPQPVLWATVDEIANAKFPGGLAYLATHNNNASANPPIIGNSITDNVTLTGPGDYYVTNINLAGQKQIFVNNTNGPVNLWVGPSGGNGTCRFRGGTSAISVVQNPANALHVYVATRSGIDLAGNQTIDGEIYAYNKDVNGAEYGFVQNSGNPTINGHIISSQVNLNGNITINYEPGLTPPTSFGYFGFDNSWVELNGVNQ